MNRSLRLGIGTASLLAIALAGCNGTSTATRHDAAADARDVPRADTAGDATVPSDRPVDRAGGDDTPQPVPETGDEPTLPSDGLADLPGGPDVRQIGMDDGSPSPDEPVTADASADLVADQHAPDDRSSDRTPPTADASAADDAQPDANSSTFTITAVPNRALDLVFMIDNSPSMAPKQAKLKAQFSRLIDAIKDPRDGTLPDLRLALIDSDLGTAGAYTNNACAAKTLPDGTSSIYGDLGRFQMIGATTCGVTSPDAQWLEYQQGQPVNYTGDLGDVFTCLATNLGTMGCGEEHALQAFEFALVAHNVGNDLQQTMLRPNAYLGLVFLTDEEDCSAATNDGMFGDIPTLRGESASLRCSTRAHACNGINLTDEPPGYPTTQAFSSPLSTCRARTDDCPNIIDGSSSTDTSEPTTCSPLRGVKRLADELKALKARPDDQIFVAGIFGWPLDDADQASAVYKIAPIPNPNIADVQHPTVFDVWPICYDPDHLPGSADGGTGFDVTAAGWGATPGLRLAAFIDEFGDNGMKLSICHRDFAEAMSKIGAALARQSPNLCLPERSDRYTSCSARYLVPDSSGNLVPQSSTMPLCNDAYANRPCYRLVTDASRCLAGQLHLQIVMPGNAAVDGGTSLPAGTIIEFTCD